MNHVLLVGLGGFIGSILRFWISGSAHRWFDAGFPIGTLIVNILGCFAAGVIWSLLEVRQWLNPESMAFLTVGVLGGFTTFSAFGHETFTLLRDGRHTWALANVAANVVLGIGAVILGWTITKAIAGASSS